MAFLLSSVLDALDCVKGYQIRLGFHWKARIPSGARNREGCSKVFQKTLDSTIHSFPHEICYNFVLVDNFRENCIGSMKKEVKPTPAKTMIARHLDHVADSVVKTNKECQDVDLEMVSPAIYRNKKNYHLPEVISFGNTR